MGNLTMLKIKLLLLIIPILLVRYVFEEKIKYDNLIQTTNSNQNWIESFKEFRNSLYHNNKTKLKSFFKFPVMNENNEIWYLIEDEHQLTFANDEIKPFTETDFNNYYFKVFYQYFINSIMKIKTKGLFEKGEYVTAMQEDKGISYKTYAKYDKKSHQVILNFYTEEKYKTDKNGEYEKSEFSKIYYFDILPNNKLQFNKIRLAG